MTDEEMRDCYMNAHMVEVKNNDYEFCGYITTIFRKYEHKDDHLAGGATGPWRCVVQNGNRFLVIQSAKNLQVVKPIK